MNATLAAWSPRVLSLLRIAAALIFIAHGTQKLFGFPTPPQSGLPPAFSLYWVGGVLEAFGGAMLLVGLFTRPVAFILSGMMAVAYWMFHAPRGVYPLLNGGDAAILYCFVFLYIAFAGGGVWSLDRLIGRRAPEPAWAR